MDNCAIEVLDNDLTILPIAVSSVASLSLGVVGVLTGVFSGVVPGDAFVFGGDSIMWGVLCCGVLDNDGKEVVGVFFLMVDFEEGVDVLEFPES